MRKFKQLTTIAAISAFLLLLSNSAVSGNVNPHLIEAIDQAETAQIHGKAGHTSTLLEYAQQSLNHAKEAEKELTGAPQHLKESIKHLEEAIAHAQQDHGEVANQHVIEAIQHLRQSAAQ